MKRRTWGLLGISVVCLASLIAVAVTYHENNNFQTLSESNGLAAANTALVNAEMALKSNHTNSASQDIERASGSFMAIYIPMRVLGYHHVSDIAVHLELIGKDVQKGTVSQEERQYLNRSEKALSSLWDTNGQIIAKKVGPVMNQMYQSIPE